MRMNLSLRNSCAERTCADGQKVIQLFGFATEQQQLRVLSREDHRIVTGQCGEKRSVWRLEYKLNLLRREFAYFADLLTKAAIFEERVALPEIS